MKKLIFILFLLLTSCSRVDFNIVGNSNNTFDIDCYGWSPFLSFNYSIISHVYKNNVSSKDINKTIEELRRITEKNIVLYDSLKSLR